MAANMISGVLMAEEDPTPKARSKVDIEVNVHVMEMGRSASNSIGKRRVRAIANLSKHSDLKLNSLMACLRSLPVRADPAISLRYVSEVFRTLLAFENSEEIDAAIDQLTLADHYVLMVAILRCFSETTNDNREKIILWKTKVAARAGDAIAVSRKNKSLARVFDFYFQKC